jgi:LEA14-like dessication related protein
LWVPVARSPARLLVVLALGASACSWLQMAEGGFKKPAVAYKSASLTDVSLSGATLNVVTSVDNPNPVSLALAEVDYRLSIDGHPVATGKPPDGLEIPANGATDVTLPASFKFTDLGQAVATVLSKGSAGYRAEGTLGVKTPIGLVKVPLSHEGTFTLPEMPGIALGTPRVTGVAIDHATVELPVTLTGKGNLPVPLQALQAAVSIGGARIGEVSAKDLGTLEPGASRSVTLPLTVPFSGALGAAQAMLKGGSVPIALEGQLQSGPAPVPFALKTTAQFRR